MGSFSHVDKGHVSMVDVGAKPPTPRYAAAAATVTLPAEAYAALHHNAKGPVVQTARLAAIAAAKRTAELIPLCHSLPLSHVAVEVAERADACQLHITASASCVGSTGVEMEALTAASVAALTVYDMCKSASKGIVISEIRLLEKRGGESGHWKAELCELSGASVPSR